MGDRINFNVNFNVSGDSQTVSQENVNWCIEQATGLRDEALAKGDAGTAKVLDGMIAKLGGGGGF